MTAAVVVSALSAMPRAQTPDYANIGRTPTDQEIRSWDIAIGPSGKELPSGSGSAKEGMVVYLARCQVCHGPALEGTQYGSRLVGSKATLTTLWDYTNRAMPRSPFKEGSLTASEVYAVTAFILYKNGIIQETDVMDARTLPKVQMPNRDGFVPVRPDWTWYQRFCHLGNCRPR